MKTTSGKIWFVVNLNNGNAATEKEDAHHIMKVDTCIIACRKVLRIKINTCHAMYDTHNAKVFK